MRKKTNEELSKGVTGYKKKLGRNLKELKNKLKK